MRHFVYFSSTAQTSGKFGDNLMKAGRMDIAIHSIIAAFFLSHDIRADVVMHLVFYGMPDPPKHIEIHGDRVSLNKKDVAKVLSKALYKGKGKEKREVFEGVFVEKRSFLNVIEDLMDEGNDIFILDKRGNDIRKIDIPEDCAFVLGDQDGLPKKEMKRLKKTCELVTIGPKLYFASQTVAVVNNEIDYRGR
jgi:tRNA (pseudouridine54-N1)-methyltransferase